MLKITIKGRTLNTKGMIALALAFLLSVSAVAAVGYTVLHKSVDAVVAEQVGTEDVSMAWGTEVASVVEAIESVNGELNGPKMKQAINMFHNLNGTHRYSGDLTQVPAGTYTVPVIK